MAPGAFFSYFSGDNDEIQLNDTGIEQRHKDETEQTSNDLLNQLCEESLIRTPRQTMKNTRDCDFDDLEATTPSNKKSKIDDEIVDKKQDDTSANFITTSCSFGLIKTEGDNNGICIIKLNQVFLSCSLIFKEEFEQKVTITRVHGNGKVASVEVRRPGSCPVSNIHVGVGNTCCLNEGDLLIVRSNQNPNEYTVVLVDNYLDRNSTTTDDDFEDFESVSAILGEINSTDWTDETLLEGDQLETNSGQPYKPIEMTGSKSPETTDSRLNDFASICGNEQEKIAAQVAEENNLAEVELEEELEVEERLVTTITNTTNNNNTIAPLATKPVTPETDRKKQESESQSETESTGLCDGRRYVSDLNSSDPTTKYPTNWMSDRAYYDSEATVVDNERYCLDKSESGDVRAINIKDDEDFLRQRLEAEEKEKEILDAAIKTNNQEKCGLQYWEKQGQTQQLKNSVCSHATYVKKKKNIQETLGFGNHHHVLPVFKSSGKSGVKLQRFRCVVNKDNGERYYQAKALVCEKGCTRKRYFSFTVGRKYLESLHDFDIDRVDKKPNKWDIPTGGDIGNIHNVTNAIETDNTIKNPFTHTPTDQPICVLLSALSALWTAGFKETAKSLLKSHRDKLHQRTPNLWNKIESLTRTSVSKPMSWFRIELPRHGIDKEVLMSINNKWPMVVQITMLDGTRTHWICIFDGWIYDSNSTNVLQKSIHNLDLCAHLHMAGSQNDFASTGMVYYFLPSILDFGKNNKLKLTTSLPNPDGFEYHEKRQCDACISQKRKAEFSKNQWRSSNNGARKCKECSK